MTGNRKIWLHVMVFVLPCILLGCASGSAIVTGNVRLATDPASVKLYLKEPQKKYEVIGLVHASSDAGWTEQESQDYAIAELKRQAAKLGANGILLTATGGKTYTVFGTTGGVLRSAPVTEKTIKGTAIFVEGEQVIYQGERTTPEEVMARDGEGDLLTDSDGRPVGRRSPDEEGGLGIQ